MKSNTLKVISKLFIGAFIIWALNSYSFAYIWANYSDCAFSETCEEKSTSTIKTYVIEGAGYFLSSHSDSLLFLNRIEVSELKGIDYGELQEIMKKAISNMKGAKESYTALTELAQASPYNAAFIQRLLDFDYDSFKKGNNLNGVIFADVKGYLGKGDVRGFYSRLLLDTGKLLKSLNLIKTTVDAEKFPGISELWRLNDNFSKTLLFGQYAAEIFKIFK